jgi:exonuclease SbcC
MAYLATLAPVREQMEAVAVEGKRLREQFDGLSADVERLQALRAEVGQLEPRASGRRGLEVRERELREERIRIQATLDYQEVARADLQRSACPLLELQCPVVQADVATLERFDLRVADLASRIGALDVELTVLTPQLTAAVAASERVQTLSVAIAKLESSERMLPEVGASLDICRTQYAELNSRVAGSAALETEKVSLEREMSRLQNIAAEAARLEVLEDGQKRDQEGLEARRADRRRVDEGLKSRASAEVDVRRLETELQRMGDPRGRQRGLQAKASRLGAIEDRLQQLQTHLQDFADKFRATVGELHRYEGLDGRIAEQKAIEERFQQDYELFIANRGDAAELDARRADLQHAEQELVAAQQAVIETQADRDAIRDQYDPEEHRSVESVHTEIMQRLASAQSDCKRWSDELRQIDEALQRARLQEQRMARKVEERAELEAAGTAVRFIRQTIKDAGPAVTETLLQNISAVANDIYAEIMDDFAPELRWDRDYEVLVQRGPDARKFAQLSGGEQMSAALAVRLALLKEMSGVDMAFFDEPTQNMDSERRVNLASQIRQIRGFHQLIVISHDDTFEHHTDNLIRLRKEEDETVVEV